jgi:hypothetical protein
MTRIITPPIRVYADTSVYGGVADEEFSVPSARFFARVRDGRFRLAVSGVVLAELEAAPRAVHEVLDEVLGMAEILSVSDQALALQRAYLDAGILTPKSADDALHVALATVSSCAMIVSWNFRHIVNYQKMPLYNAVNALHRYSIIDIHSPSEVIEDEDQDL